MHLHTHTSLENLSEHLILQMEGRVLAVVKIGCGSQGKLQSVFPQKLTALPRPPRNTTSDTSSVLSSYFGSFFQTQPHPTWIPGNLFTVLFTLNIFVVFFEMVLDQKKPNKKYPRQRPLPTLMGGCGWLVGSPPLCSSFQSDHMINTKTMWLLPLSP